MSPRPEGCGMTAAELAVWHRITAVEGAPRADDDGLDLMFQRALLDHAEATQRRRHSLDWLELVGRVALLAVIIAVLIGVTS